MMADRWGLTIPHFLHWRMPEIARDPLHVLTHHKVLCPRLRWEVTGRKKTQIGCINKKYLHCTICVFFQIICILHHSDYTIRPISNDHRRRHAHLLWGNECSQVVWFTDISKIAFKNLRARLGCLIRPSRHWFIAMSQPCECGFVFALHLNL